MNLRSAAFWTRDLLGGGPARAHLRDIELLNRGDVAAATRRVELLRDHLAYVTTRVPYYRNLGQLASLSEFPIIDKEEVRLNESSMIAEGTDRSKSHVATTSGSTGTPFRVFQNKEKRRRADAETIFFGQQAGYEFGSPLWFMRLWTGRNSYTRTAAFVRNLRPIDVSRFDEAAAAELIGSIDRQKKDISLIALSSSLETIARFFNRSDSTLTNKTRLSAVVGQSEPLSDEAREILRERLGVYPVARYGMQELGLLAQQRPSQDNTYYLNLASHVIEVLQMDTNERASEGQVGRVVVTDLFNKTQPLVRYDTGDLAVVASFEQQTGFAQSLASLEGRSRDRLYDVDDRPLAPMISYNFWWKFPDILQYQIIQRGRGDYILRLNVREGFDDEPRLIEELRKAVGATASIQVKYDASEYMQASGKHRAVVSEYTPPNIIT